jgi:hypothetical protein
MTDIPTVTIAPPLCKVVYGCGANGFKDVTEPMPYERCVEYIAAHAQLLSSTDSDPHYTPSLDIMSVETGRLMSWVLR